MPASQANTLRRASSVETGPFPDSCLCAGPEGGRVRAKPVRIISQFAIVQLASELDVLGAHV